MAGLDLTVKKPARQLSLDAYRGFVMLALASEGYFPGLASIFPSTQFLQILGRQFQHVAWDGFAFWDLIQPSFMFLAGVAIPYALASRRSSGDAHQRLWPRVVRRSIVFILLGLVISSEGTSYTDFTFVSDVLPQIGLAYPFACLVAGRGVRIQGAVVASILVAYWFAFFLHPVLPQVGIDNTAFSTVDSSQRFTGLFAHWNEHTNFAAAFDRWFLNLFPRPMEFRYHPYGLQTLSFVPSIATLIFGLMAGELLRSDDVPAKKFRCLALAGIGCLVAGVTLGHTVCPIVKAIWTPSWAVFSAGWAFLLLAGFYWLIDIKGFTKWAFPLVVMGMNSLAMYVMLRLTQEWVYNTIGKHFGDMSWTLQFVTADAVLWLVCLWLYRRRIVITV